MKLYFVLFLFSFIHLCTYASDYVISAQGCKTKNVFLTQVDLINRLSWKASGTDLPAQWGIYRDSDLTDKVAILPVEITTYLDHNREPGVTYTYYIVGIDSENHVSDPVVVTVSEKC